MEKPHELQNQINRCEAAIEQTKNSAVYNEMEQRDQLKRLGEELEVLQLRKLKNIEVKDVCDSNDKIILDQLEINTAERLIK